MASSKLNNGIQCVMTLQRPTDTVARSGQLAGIIGSELVDVLAAREPIHRELANLPDDEGAVLKFVRRWGRVRTYSDKLPKTLRTSQELFVGPLAEVTEALREAHPETEGGWDAPVLFFDEQPEIIYLRDKLRRAWEGNADALDSLEQALKEQVSSTLAFKESQIEITARDAWTLTCLLFLLDHAKGKTAVCKNPNCLARYFIAGRKNQQFCGNDECFAFAARTRTTTWWGVHGKKWREQRRKKAQKKGRKQR